jgi:hypothetical protein
MKDHSNAAENNKLVYDGHVEAIQGGVFSIKEAAEMFDLPPIVKRFGDWAVTEEGIGSLQTNYWIEAKRALNEKNWVEHVGSKTWVNKVDFSNAYKYAVKIYSSKNNSDIKNNTLDIELQVNGKNNNLEKNIDEKNNIDLRHARVWILQARSDITNLSNELVESDIIEWTIKGHYSKNTSNPRFEEGDIVYFWQAGAMTLHGWGVVHRGPEKKGEGSFEHTIVLKCIEKFKEPISKADIFYKDKALSKVRPFNPAPGASFALEASNAVALDSAIESFGYRSPRSFLGNTQILRGDRIKGQLGVVVPTRRPQKTERSLKVDQYSRILSAFIASANDEFCFALFGHWGRGKTYLIELVADLLGKEKQYDIVKFNAWKYRSVPETWISLYEEFREVSENRGFFSKIASIVRKNIFRHGLNGLSLVFFIWCLAFIPWTYKAKLLHVAWPAVGGVGGVITVLVLAYRLYRAKPTISKYFNQISHKDKLGIQSVVGEDLKSLLLGWIPGKEKIPRSQKVLMFFTFFVLIGILLYQSINFSGDFLFYINQYTYYFFAIILSVLMVGFVCLVIYAGKEKQKILLVVDDLDRCEPVQKLEVIESLLLLLDDSKIKDRLKIVMLIEERMLRFAVFNKYKMHIESEKKHLVNDENLMQNIIINEHIEKLFISHLRLDGLDTLEAHEVLINHIGKIDNNEGVTKVNFSISENEIAVNQNEPNVSLESNEYQSVLKTESELDVLSSISSQTTGVMKLNEEELKALKLLLQQLSDSKNYNLGPRRIRSLVLKYKLSSLLLHCLDEGYIHKPEIICKFLLNINANVGPGENGVKKIVNQVY